MRGIRTRKRGRAHRSGSARGWLSRAVAGAVLAHAGSALAQAELPHGTLGSAAFSAEALVDRAFSDRLLEQIVGARKREENVQEVPGSITTIAHETLERSDVRRLNRIERSTPNLVFNELGNMGRISLRGIGQTQTLLVSGDTGVGVYIDGVFVARSQGQLPLLFDIERVEVLRSPQGTLFGSNSPGGAISVVTRKPTFQRAAEAELRVGNLNALESRVAVNLPLVPEGAALRLSAATATRDGFTKNIVDGERLNDDKELSGRAELLVLPTDDVELLLSGYYTRKNRAAFALKCTTTGGRAEGATQSADLFEAVGGRKACLEDMARDEFAFASDTPFSRDSLDLFGGSVQATWDIGPNLTLMSLTALRNDEGRLAVEGDATQIPFFGFANDRGRAFQRQWSQEFQLLGQAFGGRLRYVAGLYGFRERASQAQFLLQGLFPTDTFASVLPPALLGLTGNEFAPGVIRNPEIGRALFRVNNLSYAAFGQGTYALTDRLDLTLGLRFTHERKRVLTDRSVGGCLQGDDINPLLLEICRQRIGQAPFTLDSSIAGFERSTRFSEFSPQATLNYRWSDELSLYASYATGFRNGGFDVTAVVRSQTEPIAPEDITSYEVGFKSTWLDGRLRLNAAAFYTLQERVRLAVDLGGDVAGDGNAGDALLRGGELEFLYLLTERLGVSASLGALRARYRNLHPRFKSLEGEQLALAPNYTMNFGLDYRAPLGRFGTLAVRTSWTHHGSQQNDPSGTDATVSGKYGLLDGRISLALPDGRTELAVFGSNLLDRRYFDGAVASPSFGTAGLFFGPPRLYGVEIRRSF